MPLHQPTMLGSRPQSHHLVFDQSESVAATTSPLDYSEAKMRAAPTALTAEYVADDQPVYDRDVISAEPRAGRQAAVCLSDRAPLGLARDFEDHGKSRMKREAREKQSPDDSASSSRSD